MKRTIFLNFGIILLCFALISLSVGLICFYVEPLDTDTYDIYPYDTRLFKTENINWNDVECIKYKFSKNNYIKYDNEEPYEHSKNLKNPLEINLFNQDASLEINKYMDEHDIDIKKNINLLDMKNKEFNYYSYMTLDSGYNVTWDFVDKEDDDIIDFLFFSSSNRYNDYKKCLADNINVTTCYNFALVTDLDTKESSFYKQQTFIQNDLIPIDRPNNQWYYFWTLSNHTSSDNYDVDNDLITIKGTKTYYNLNKLINNNLDTIMSSFQVIDADDTTYNFKYCVDYPGSKEKDEEKAWFYFLISFTQNIPLDCHLNFDCMSTYWKVTISYSYRFDVINLNCFYVLIISSILFIISFLLLISEYIYVKFIRKKNDKFNLSSTSFNFNK
eukprot:TRINITY_DN14354_c0_g1_i1.p1 TRINITY_DN14354_c0_g1~~TRINITY_DN14354_c0_g1_i1.p1  ORF type:complete len:386 (-),score=51.06 TRINITY_DN14354_c0_g1_i1:82-1239(-)